jgi:hypothetical protein
VIEGVRGRGRNMLSMREGRGITRKLLRAFVAGGGVLHEVVMGLVRGACTLFGRLDEGHLTCGTGSWLHAFSFVAYCCIYAVFSRNIPICCNHRERDLSCSIM